jgi:hypothetical protein
MILKEGGKDSSDDEAKITKKEEEIAEEIMGLTKKDTIRTSKVDSECDDEDFDLSDDDDDDESIDFSYSQTQLSDFLKSCKYSYDPYF